MIIIRTAINPLCGSVVEWLGCWTCDQQVVVSTPGLPAVECNPGQVVSTHVPLSPSSIIWYQPVGVMPCGLEAKRRSGVAGPRDTDINGSPRTGSRPWRGR